MTIENRDPSHAAALLAKRNREFLQEEVARGQAKLAAARRFIDVAAELGTTMPLHEVLDAMWLAMLASGGPSAVDAVQAVSVFRSRANS
jgi:hypothetical protein